MSRTLPKPGTPMSFPPLLGLLVLALVLLPGAAAGTATVETYVFPGAGGAVSSTGHSACVTVGEPAIGICGGDDHGAAAGFQRWLGARPTNGLR